MSFSQFELYVYNEPFASGPVAKQVLNRAYDTSSFWTRQHVQVRALKDVLSSLIVIFCPSLLLSARIIMTFHGKIDVITEEKKGWFDQMARAYKHCRICVLIKFWACQDLLRFLTISPAKDNIHTQNHSKVWGLYVFYLFIF